MECRFLSLHPLGDLTRYLPSEASPMSKPIWVWPATWHPVGERGLDAVASEHADISRVRVLVFGQVYGAGQWPEVAA